MVLSQRRKEIIVMKQNGLIAFNANAIGKQHHELSKSAVRLMHRCGPVFRDTPETSSKVFIPKSHIYRKYRYKGN
jgi:hypothetical protein